MNQTLDAPPPGADVEEIDTMEVITMADNRFVCEHLTDAGWEQHSGMLERREQHQAVAVERRRPA